MRIAVVGATGTLGQPTVEVLRSRGHEVLELSRRSRSHPVELTTGAGLDSVHDVDVVINASNAPPGRSAGSVLVDGTRRLLQATAAHHVCVSIVGIDDVPMGYYRVKLAQEAVVRESGRPFTILRATQFHGLLGQPLRKVARWHVELHSRVRFQPVEVTEVAAAAADVAERGPTDGIVTVAGPEVLTLTQMRAGRGLPIPVPMPGRAARAMKDGRLTIADPDVRGQVRYSDWLSRA
jgi:uncharacterized protein YbjT (DUF2867 family)